MTAKVVEFRLDAEPITRAGGYLKLTARAIAGAGEYLSDYDDAYELQVSAQSDPSGAAEGRQPYAWSVEYAQPYTVDLRRAERMVAVLRKVSKRLATLDAKYGYAPTFSAYVLRVADALGISAFIGAYGPNAPEWTQGQMRGMNPQEAAAWIDARISEYAASAAKEL